MLGLSPAALFTIHRGQRGTTGLSPRIWALLFDSILSPDGGNDDPIQFDHFKNFSAIAPAIAGAVAGASGGYVSYQDTATTTSSIQQSSSLDEGVIDLLTGATSHHEVSIQACGGTGCNWKLPSARGGNIRAFEARVKLPAATSQGVFVGLAAPGSAATNFMVDTTMALKDANLIGFHIPLGATNTIRPVFRKSGVAVNDSIGSVKTFTAGDWVKLGFIYNSAAQASEAFQFFVDNVKVAVLSQAEVDSILPVNAGLAPILSVKTLGAVASTLSCDWMGVGRA